jgi:hypothetical protein
VAWETFQSNDGIYLVNWEGLARIIRSAVRSQAMLAFSEEKIDKHFIGPDIHSVEVNWGKVRETTALEGERILRNFYYGARSSMRGQLSQLSKMVTQGEKNHLDFQSKMNAAQRKTMANIDTAVSRGELGEHIAREIRDASVEVLMVGATALSGGTAAAVVGAGSFLKGAYSYQDTHHLSTAVMTASTNLLMGAIPLKINPAMEARFGKLGWGILWAKIEGVAEVPKSILEGEHLPTAVGKGIVKSGLGTPHELVKHALEHSRSFGRWAFPAELAFKAIEISGQRWLATAAENKSERKTPPLLPPAHTKAEKLSAAAIYGHDEIEQFAVRQIGSTNLSRSATVGSRR